jgi:hypothetical protein
LFYLSSDNKVIATAIETGGDALKVGSTQTLFEVRSRQVLYSGWNDTVFDVSADGQRFLVNSVVTQTTSTPLNLVVNWPALLKK